MPEKRKVDLIRTEEDFRSYVSGKNKIANKMLEIFDELTYGRQLELGKSHFVDAIYLGTPLEFDLLKYQTAGAKKFSIRVNAYTNRERRIGLDTGTIEIDDKGQMSDMSGLECMNSSFMDGSHGLVEAAAEFQRVAQIYKRLFGDKYIPSNFRQL